MKLFKKLLLAVVVVVILVVIVSFFLPSHVHVERRTRIQAPSAVVFEQINVLTNWEAWSPWHKLDPSMKLQYSGAASGVGAKYTWESQQRNVGNGSLTITESAQDKLVRTAMDFGGQGQAKAAFALEPEGNATVVIWSMDTDLGRNPIAKLFGLMMDSMIGPDFERGLENLKRVSESKHSGATPAPR